MPWISGRQGGGYEKFPLFSFWKVDCYLIRYRKNAEVKWHRDPVQGKRHYRLNILLQRSEEGGMFLLNGPSVFQFWRIRIFRPDLYAHRVLPVKSGERLILSLGWVKEKQ